MKKFLALLVNEPWLVEKRWLENMISIFHNEEANAIELLKSERLVGTEKVKLRGNVAYMSLDGPIFSKPNILTELLGIGTVIGSFVKDLSAAAENPDIDNIVIDIDSPGGTVTGINEASNIIKEISQEKPITAYVSGTGASAAYWLASSASEIVLDATSRVGSIGVVVAYPKPEADDYYVEIVNTASPNKRVDPTTDSGKAVITAELDALAEVFIETVASNRGVSATTVMNDFGKGGVLVGQKAVNVGMADRLGSFEGLLSEKTIENSKEGDETMNLEELKAKFPDLFSEVVKQGETSKAAEMEAAIAEKDQEIKVIQKKLEQSTAANEVFEDRMKALEKSEALRREKDIAATASTIRDSKLNASDIPARLHKKVTAYIDHNKFVADGVLDVDSFKAAVDSEIADWEKELGACTSVMGIGRNTPPVGEEEDTNGEDVVSRLLGHIGVEGK